MATLVDTNVILDLLIPDPVWADWSETHLTAAAARGPLLINMVVYAELASRYDAPAALEEDIYDAGLVMHDIPSDALFLAGKAFRAYRAQRGSKTGVLPDFFIGAHAAVAGLPLLTRDPQKIRRYFPTVELITPAPLS